MHIEHSTQNLRSVASLRSYAFEVPKRIFFTPEYWVLCSVFFHDNTSGHLSIVTGDIEKQGCET